MKAGNMMIVAVALSLAPTLPAFAADEGPTPQTLVTNVNVFDGNPLDDVAVLGDDGKNIPLIMKDGRIYKNALK